MKTIKQRQVEVLICDFCGQEVRYLERCANCGREGCTNVKRNHWAYHFDLYRCEDQQRFAGYGTSICKECEDIIRIFDHLTRWWEKQKRKDCP